MKNAKLIDGFTARAADYQRRTRKVSQELRDLNTLHRAQELFYQHTGGHCQQTYEMIQVIEEMIVETLGLDLTKDFATY